MDKGADSTITWTGVTFLSGQEANLDANDKALLKQFNEMAKNMGIKSPIKLFSYERVNGDDGPNANSYMMNGTYVVGISQSLKRTMSAGSGSDLISSAVERMVAVMAHEEAHVKRKDMKPGARGQHPGLDSINTELATDKKGMRATCNPQALEEALTLAYLDAAREAGTTLSKIIKDELQDASQMTHPLLPTRLAHLEYMKAHPSRSCKGK